MEKSDEIFVEKLGLNQTDVFRLIVFRELQSERLHPAAIYEIAQDVLRGKKVSRTLVYRTMEEMERSGWIQSELDVFDRRRKLFDITAEGLHKQQWYYEKFYEAFSDLKKVAIRFLEDITGPGVKGTPEMLSPKNKQFVSRIINVRKLVQYLIYRDLSNLPEYEGMVAAQIWKSMKENYGWQAAEGYFYEIITELEDKLQWIKGEWDNPNRRSKKFYRLTDEGLQMLPTVGTDVVKSIRDVRDFMNSVLELFGTMDAAPKTSISDKKEI